MKCLWITCFLVVCSTATAAQNVVIVLDDSASMNTYMANGKSRIVNAKAALVKVVSGLSNDTNLGVVVMNNKPNWIVPLGPVDKKQAIDRIKEIIPVNGTPLGVRMKDGADALLKMRGSEPYGSYRLLIVTDGEANDPDLVELYLPDILSRGILIDAIGVGMQEDHSLATKVNYRRGDNPEQLTEAISATFAETTSDDASDSFDIIAGLPDGMASELLGALNQVGNHPIGEKPPVPVNNATNTVVNATWGNPNSGSSNSSILMAIVIGIVVVGVLILILKCVSDF